MNFHEVPSATLHAMNTSTQPAPAPLQPKANFWVECQGQVVLSGWRVRLLEAVDQAGSISGAADLLDIPYKLAWERLHEMEGGLGQQLVETRVGGTGGGGASLTAVARDYVRRWHRFSDDLRPLVLQEFAKAFGSGEA
jgi:molybdate transport system regulatory protein